MYCHIFIIFILSIKILENNLIQQLINNISEVKKVNNITISGFQFNRTS